MVDCEPSGSLSLTKLGRPYTNRAFRGMDTGWVDHGPQEMGAVAARPSLVGDRSGSQRAGRGWW